MTRWALTTANSSPDPGWVSAAIQDRADTDYICLDAVINREGKAFTETAVISENSGMNTTVNGQRVDIFEDRLAKIAAETPSLSLIKLKSRE